jgi:ribosomal protein S30
MASQLSLLQQKNEKGELPRLKNKKPHETQG